MNQLQQIFAPAEATYNRSITHNTWGHLAPKPNTTHTGHILFTHGCYGDITPIDYNFTNDQGEELDASPWLYEDIQDHIAHLIDTHNLPRGRIYHWTGTYTRTPDHPKNKGSTIMVEGKGIFHGKTTKIKIQKTRT